MGLRRSRSQRTSTGKHIALTPRDLVIFRSLARYRYLRSTYLHAFAGGASETRFKERLGDLFHEGFLNRPERQWLMADSRYRPAVHELSKRGSHILSEHETVPAPSICIAPRPHRQFEHSLMICEILASLELAIDRSVGRRFIAWPEILRKAPLATQQIANPFRLANLIPDAVFGIEYTVDALKRYRFFAIEADRGTMPITRSDPRQSSIEGKMLAYSDVIARRAHQLEWGIPNLLVLTITSSEARLKNMQKLVSEVNVVATNFLFKAVDGTALLAPRSELFMEPWNRGRGMSPLALDKAE